MIPRTRQAWQRPVSPQEAYRRASGRRAYNLRRQIQAQLRQQRVFRLLRHGHTQAQMAQALGVSAATVSRDVATLLRHGLLVRPYWCIREPSIRI